MEAKAEEKQGVDAKEDAKLKAYEDVQGVTDLILYWERK